VRYQIFYITLLYNNQIKRVMNAAMSYMHVGVIFFLPNN